MSESHTNRSVAAVWRRYDADEVRLTAGVSRRMVELAGLAAPASGPGQRVLDIATGRGEPAIQAARAVGPSGVVVGTDLDPELLAMARERAAREGIENLELVVADAHTLAGLPTIPFDAVLARWGLMYLDRPADALRRIRALVRPGAPLVAAMWVEPERAPALSMPRDVLGRLVSLPPRDLTVPGTFRFADPAETRRVFADAGWRIDHAEERWTDLMEARSDDELIEWAITFGVRRDLARLDAATVDRWRSAILQAAAAHRVDGTYRMGGITRLLVARPA